MSHEPDAPSEARPCATRVPARRTSRAALTTLATLLLATLGASVALAHPSGLPRLKASADYFVATSADWLFWDFHPSIVIGIVVLTILYSLAIFVWREKYGLAEQVDKPRAWGFYGSMVLLWLTLDGPLHHLSDELLFAAHMVQHLMLQLVWAALFVWSLPAWMVRAVIRPKLVRRFAVWVTRPWPAFLIYNGVTWIWHFPPMYNLALEAHEWHIVEHLLFMSTACIFYFPLLSPVEEIPRPSHGAQMMYVFGNMAAMKTLGIIISMQSDVLYTYYLKVPRVWGLTAIADQQIGGLLMWLPGGLLLWGGLGYVFAQWAMKGTPKRGTTGIAAIDARRLAASQK